MLGLHSHRFEQCLTPSYFDVAQSSALVRFLILRVVLLIGNRLYKSALCPTSSNTMIIIEDISGSIVVLVINRNAKV